MSVDRKRVVRVRMRGKTEGIYRFGSGYLIADGLILTARHVLNPPGRDLSSHSATGEGCEVAYEIGEWHEAYFEVAGEDIDAALLRTSLGRGLSTVRWAKLTGSDPVRWDAMGYPVAGLGPAGREPEHAWGEVSPLTADGTSWLGLTISSRRPRKTGAPDSGWAGLSGAAVVCANRLVGMITEDPAAYIDSLRAVRAEAVLGDQGVAAVLGYPRLDDVGGQRVQRHDPPDTDRPVVLIIDDEDAEVMRQQVGGIAHVVSATDLESALATIGDSAVRVDAALVDICIGEPTGESGRTVLEALRVHRPHVPRSVVSADPYTGMFGDITASLKKRYGVFKTLRKSGAGCLVPDLHECVSAMLRQDDKALDAIVGDQIDMVRDSYIKKLKAVRADTRRRRQRGEIGEPELQDAESRVERAEAAVAAGRQEASAAEGSDKWQAVNELRTALAAISVEAV